GSPPLPWCRGEECEQGCDGSRALCECASPYPCAGLLSAPESEHAALFHRTRDSAPDRTFESPCQSAEQRLDPMARSRSLWRPEHSACPVDSRASAYRDSPPGYDPAAIRSRGPSALPKAPCGNLPQPSPCGLLPDS